MFEEIDLGNVMRFAVYGMTAVGCLCWALYRWARG
jgi:hypothetical protein